MQLKLKQILASSVVASAMTLGSHVIASTDITPSSWMEANNAAPAAKKDTQPKKDAKADQKGAAKAGAEHKCAEGKCGEKMKKGAKDGAEHKCAEGKCGEGSCA